MITRADRRLFPILFAAITALALAGAALALLFSPVRAQEGSAPAKPTGLTAVVSHDQVALTWDDPNDDGITGYVILRRNRDTDAEGQFTELVADTGSAATGYTDGSVAAGTPYTYRIQAINGHGVSERSRWFHIDTPSVPVPDKPTGLTATASHDQVVLTWDDPGDDTITGYVILRRNRDTDAQGQFTELVADTGSAATGYTDGSAAAATPYTYRIKAINAHGSSERSRWFHIDTPAAPAPEPTPEPAPEPTPEPTPEPVSVSEGDADLPNDNSTPGRVAVGGSATGAIGTDGDQDRFAVELEAGRTYQFDLTGSPGGGGTLPDTFFRAIYDSEGQYQPDSYNDDFEDGRDSRVMFTAPESGTYYARVPGDRDETGSYTLSVTDVTLQQAVVVPGPPETEPESAQGQSTPGAGPRENVSEPAGEDLLATTSTTGQVDVGGSVTGNIGYGGDGDWFRVELEAGKRYQIDVEGAPTGRGTLTDSLVFRINDADGVWIRNTGDDDGGVGDNARKIFSPSADGAYFVWVASGTTGLTGTYTLSVIYLGANGVSEADTDLPAAAATTGVVDVGGSVTGNIDPTNDKDLFRVELVANKTYQIDLEGATNSRGTLGDPYLYGVHDALRLFIPGTENDDNPEGGLDSRLIFTPDTGGTHFLVAGAYVDVDNTGTYTLSVRDISPPPVTPPLPAVVEGGTDLAGNAMTRAVIEAGGFVARGAISEPVRGSGNYYRFDYDWFKVTLQAGRTYRFDLAPVIRVRGDGTYEVSLYPESVALYDADSNYLYHTSDRESSGPGYAARVEFTPNASGAYYISAASLGFTAGEYELTVSDITAEPDRHTADRRTIGRVSIGGAVAGKIDFLQDVDWFRVTLAAGTRYRIDLEGRATGRGSLADPWLRGIFDADGNEILGNQNDNGGQGNNSRLFFTPNALGYYYVAVSARVYHEGTYTLSVQRAN